MIDHRRIAASVSLLDMTKREMRKYLPHSGSGVRSNGMAASSS